jgi:predicted SnoaL-like aldol condensation-catalyzing enzyme
MSKLITPATVHVNPCNAALTGIAQPFDAAYGLVSAETEQANLRLVRDFHDEVLAGHQLSRLPDYISADFVQHHPVFGQGRAGLADFARFLSAFPDLSCTPDVAFAQNNRVLTQVTWRGTDAASGQRMTWQTAHVYRVLAGKIAEHWAVVDYFAIEPFGFTAPACQHQPTTPVDWFGSAQQRANLRLFVTFVNEMFVERRKEDAGTYVSTNFVNNDPMEKFGAQLMSGPGVEGFKQCFIWYDWVPDMSFTLDHVVAGENHVGGLWTWYGTHVSGAPFILHTAELYRVDAGQVAEHWTLWDFTQLRAFGITPPSQ